MLTCPKCQESMRTYERNGVNVDQCTGCKGIFLDRGELEALIGAESSFNERGYDAPQQSAYREQPTQHQQPRKKRGFLSDFLEFD